MSDEPLLAVRDLVISYGERPAVHGVSFSLRRGEILVLAGESGSGKSTILRSIIGLPDVKSAVREGEILWQGTDLLRLAADERRRIAGAEIALIFQNAGAAFCPVRTIGSRSRRIRGSCWRQIFSGCRVKRKKGRRAQDENEGNARERRSDGKADRKLLG